MKENVTKIMNALRENIDTEAGATILSRILCSMKESDADALAEEIEDLALYPDYLSEREAREVVSAFENYDGSKGPRWRDPSTVFSVAESYGIEPASKGKYNRWTFYAVMNMVHSDEWGVLRKFVAPEEEARICAELAEARLLDRDKDYSVRWYFGLD